MPKKQRQCRIDSYLGPRQRCNAGERLPLHRWRREVLTRDNHECRCCKGRISDSYRKRSFPPEAHHIVPRRHGGKNTLENGATLCRFCHNYFDYAYAMHNRDFHEVISTTGIEERINAVKIMMRQRYAAHLRKLMSYN